ncbi:MAG: PAS domain-containing hybrid sensor histidine kinase/response regulator, partial [Thermoanaerobaculia bacterium]
LRAALFATVALLMVWVIVARDSAVDRAAAARDESYRTFRILADSAPVLVWMSDVSPGRTFFNRGWLEFRGRALEDERDRQWTEGVHPDDVESVKSTADDATSARKPFRMEYRLLRNDGAWRWVVDSGVPRFDGAGEFEGYVGACVDITEDKEAREHLQAANRTKDEFLATLSHELRTPLTAILGWAHMLRMGGLDPATEKAALETIERSARAQQALIDELLDVSRIVRGRFVVEPKETNVSAIVMDAVDSLRTSAEARSVELDISVPPEPLVAWVDAGRFRQIVWILGTNAIKFNHDDGRVGIALDSTAGRLRLKVSDTGSGIAPHVLPHVFDRFRQADSSSTRSYGGLGLGLSIVKDVVEMHGGVVSAESAGPGHGATFTVMMPISQARAPRPAVDAVMRDSGPILEGSMILVVDDDADNRALVRRILEMRGARVTVASSADEALVAINREKPALVISDLAMPVMDGFSLATSVRGQDVGVPMIALSAFGRADDETHALASGFNRFLRKPIDPKLLATTAAELMKR